jgi:hypothetical protein
VLISADYLKLRQSIINGLKPYPEAARAVGRALAGLEVEVAETIKTSSKPLLLEAMPA